MSLVQIQAVKCDRCGELLTRPDRAQLEEAMSEALWWTHNERKRNRIDWCDPCHSVMEENRRAILEQLGASVCS